MSSMYFTSQNTYVKFYYAISVPNSLNSHVSFVPIFNRLNFSDWNKQVQFHLSVLDLDLALLEEKFAAIIGVNSTEEKAHYKVYERSIRLSLIFMRMSIADNIKTTIPKTKNAKEFIGLVEECFQTVDKSFAKKLMSTLTTMKFYDSHTMH